MKNESLSGAARRQKGVMLEGQSPSGATQFSVPNAQMVGSPRWGLAILLKSRFSTDGSPRWGSHSSLLITHC